MPMVFCTETVTRNTAISGRDFVGIFDGNASECGFHMAVNTVVWSNYW